MKEPRHLVRGDLSPLERAVLRSAEMDAPSARARTRTLAALGLATAAATASTTAAATASTTATASGAATAAAATGTAAPITAAPITAASIATKTAAAILAPAVVKWMGVGLVAATVVGIGAVQYDANRAPAPAPAMTTTSAAPPSLPSPPSPTSESHLTRPLPAAAPSAIATQAPAVSTISAPPAPPAPAPLAPPAPTTARATAEPTTDVAIARDLALLDRASAALAGGDPAGALARLDEGGDALMHGPLAPEAAVLRIEALASTGQTARARTEALAFLGAHPASPQARRVRSLLSRMEEKP